MPSYKTHSIHSELIYDEIDQRIKIDKDDLKTFAMGPDTLIATNSKAFKINHRYAVREYFELLLKLIKCENLIEDSETMAFLYGQLDHFVLDAITHPLIYYMTEGEPAKHSTKPHGLCEIWTDDYMMQKYDRKDIFYYKKFGINNKKLKALIDEVYSRVYGFDNVGNAYDKGIKFLDGYDTLVRRNLILITPIATKLANVGDMTYNKDTSRVLKYLNQDGTPWYNPETLELHTESFEELFDKAKDVALETIKDVNRYLYDGKPLDNSLILNNTSYNTGINCDLGQHFRRVRKCEY